MRNSMKVAKWEYKKNMKNKSFIISLLITPLIFIIFSSLPSFMDMFKSESDPVKVYIQDEMNMWGSVEETLLSQGIEWEVQEAETDESGMKEIIKNTENTAYISFSKNLMEQGKLTVYTNEEIDKDFEKQVNVLVQPLRDLQIENLHLSQQEKDIINQGITIDAVSLSKDVGEVKGDPLKRLIPGVFAGVILFSIVMTGMMIFQSASNEKKEKVAEIVLSSVDSSELMQGKIIGYFALGITQVLAWILVIVPYFMWKSEFPILEYLLVPETILLVFIAVLGYLLFAAIFAGIGATFEDMDQTSNFQGIVFLLPWLPAALYSPVISDPEGIIAQAGSYFPLTSPGVLIMRLSVLESWPWIEIFISIIILLISIWLFMKLAGKIFKIGILMYGKNATPKEILKWLRY
ncbi:ABC transporter permease [Cytobacillus praedii]|uniref:ABC transporter permease n=1 Tax=Cytobacillus praedii TaxID=1742358 RepID=UPI002E1F4B04|nr:ABC transporter permease [Cytobacillus praedii]